MKLSIKC